MASTTSASASVSTSDLWTKALKTLCAEDRQHIDLSRPGKIDILRDILETVKEKRQLCLDRRWTYKKKNGEVIICRDLFDKVTHWVNKFKEVGDVAVQYGPGHAALPWAGVRFLLQLVVDDSQIFGAMLEGIEYVSNLITRYTLFEQVYLRGASGHRDNLEHGIVKIYAEILAYLSTAKRYYSHHTIGRFTTSAMKSDRGPMRCFIKSRTKKRKSIILLVSLKQNGNEISSTP
ncbi:MAG: hypothetical protein M1819_006954 [Sarea resinae]|nr:MAG: hypothetical protein M1819_006954 [Sarea resinae]